MRLHLRKVRRKPSTLTSAARRHLRRHPLLARYAQVPVNLDLYRNIRVDGAKPGDDRTVVIPRDCTTCRWCITRHPKAASRRDYCTHPHTRAEYHKRVEANDDDVTLHARTAWAPTRECGADHQHWELPAPPAPGIVEGCKGCGHALDISNRTYCLRHGAIAPHSACGELRQHFTTATIPHTREQLQTIAALFRLTLAHDRDMANREQPPALPEPPVHPRINP